MLGIGIMNKKQKICLWLGAIATLLVGIDFLIKIKNDNVDFLVVWATIIIIAVILVATVSVIRVLAPFDSFYNDVKRKKFFYESNFQKILKSIDVENYTNYLNNWLHKENNKYDDKQLEHDDKIFQKIAEEAVSEEKLKPFYLQILVYQYLLADIIEREIHKDHWVDKVLHRKQIDFFPDHRSLYKFFE
jgi:hypothetical protein